MGLLPLKNCLNSFNAGTAFRHLNLTSVDPRAERINAFCIISDVIVRHKKYILIHHLLSHILYKIYFSLVKVNISLLYVSTVKSQISKYFINSIGILVLNCDRHA